MAGPYLKALHEIENHYTFDLRPYVAWVARSVPDLDRYLGLHYYIAAFIKISGEPRSEHSKRSFAK
jgi:hypothetical protein